MNQIIYQPIGVIHSPFTSLEDMPIQPPAARGFKGQVIIKEEYLPALADLDGFSHIYLLYHLHLSTTYDLKVVPFLDDRRRGLFATRAPRRPNPIGLSMVQLLKIEGNILEIANPDVIDGTPLLDIKPYVAEMEVAEDYKIGWLSKYIDQLKEKRSDKRFK